MRHHNMHKIHLLCPEVKVRIPSAFCDKASSLHLHPLTLAAHFYAIGNRQNLLEMAMVGLGGIEMEAEPSLWQGERSRAEVKGRSDGNQVLGAAHCSLASF